MNADTIAAWIILACAVAWLTSPAILAALIWLDRHNEEVDAIRAADHGEPARADVEAAWQLDETTEEWRIFPAIEFQDQADFDQWEQEVAS